MAQSISDYTPPDFGASAGRKVASRMQHISSIKWRIRCYGLAAQRGKITDDFRKTGVMLNQPHVLGRCKFCQLRVWYLPSHALACFRLEYRISISGQHKCRYVNRFESRGCIVAEHPKHTSSHYSGRSLQLEAGYKIKLLPCLGASKT